MKKINLLLIIFGLICAMPTICCAVVGGNWIEQYGIRWTFDKNISSDGAGDTYHYGQFVNGDYWVIGPINITSINPPSRIVGAGGYSQDSFTFNEGDVINGSMLNPSISNQHGYRHVQGYWTSIGYKAELNAGLGISADLPLYIPADSAFVSTISQVPTHPNVSQVKTAAILTILPSNAFAGLPQGTRPEDCFRPAVTASQKKILFNKTMLSQKFLGKLVNVFTAYPGVLSPAQAESAFNKSWITHVSGWTQRCVLPADNMPEYYIGSFLNRIFVVLNLNHTDEQKNKIVVYMTQLGIDLYGVIQSNNNIAPWAPDGGHNIGRLMPILFAGKALNCESMLYVCQKSGDYMYSSKPDGAGNYAPGDLPPDYSHFPELDQTFRVTQLEVDITNGNHPSIKWTPSMYLPTNPNWKDNGGTWEGPGNPFTQYDIGMPSYGIRHSMYPSWTAKKWNIYKDYQGQNSPTYVDMAFYSLVMGLKPYFNHDVFFDYADRWVSVNKPSQMWSAYRANYGPVWTPGSIPVVQDPNNPGNPNLPSGTIPENTELSILNNVLKTGVAYATVKLMLSESENASVKIYDSKGREIITLWDGHKEAGEYNLPWDGKDSSGKKVGSGVYMVHMQAGSYKETKKIVVLK